MSVDIDDLVRRGAESCNARDPEAGLELWDPDCEWHPFLSTQVEGAAGYRGHDGIRQWFRDTDEMFSGVLWTVETVRNLGDGRILVLGHLQARGRIGGVEVSSQLGQLWELRGGRIVHGRAYPSHEQALRAAGLADPV